MFKDFKDLENGVHFVWRTSLFEKIGPATAKLAGTSRTKMFDPSEPVWVPING